MKTAVGITAHPSRIKMANDLRDKVSADFLCVDNESKGEQWNHQMVLKVLLETNADWVVILEDDSIPCRKFREKLEKYLSGALYGVVSLYLGTGRWAGEETDTQKANIKKKIEYADANDLEWIGSNKLWHAVGIALPRRYAECILAYLNSVPTLPTDIAISLWAQKNRVSVFYTHPSLVDHRDCTRIVSTFDKPVKRVAWAFEDERRV